MAIGMGTGGMPGALSSSNIPSPEGSPTMGVASLLSHTQVHRRRTTSYHLPSARHSTVGLPAPIATVTASPSSPLATGTGVGIGASASSRLASLASSWGVSFGRRKRAELVESEGGGGGGRASAPGTSSPIPESPTQGSD